MAIEIDAHAVASLVKLNACKIKSVHSEIVCESHKRDIVLAEFDFLRFLRISRKGTAADQDFNVPNTARHYRCAVSKEPICAVIESIMIDIRDLDKDVGHIRDRAVLGCAGTSERRPIDRDAVFSKTISGIE